MNMKLYQYVAHSLKNLCRHISKTVYNVLLKRKKITCLQIDIDQHSINKMILFFYQKRESRFNKKKIFISQKILTLLIFFNFITLCILANTIFSNFSHQYQKEELTHIAFADSANNNDNNDITFNGTISFFLQSKSYALMPEDYYIQLTHRTKEIISNNYNDSINSNKHITIQDYTSDPFIILYNDTWNKDNLKVYIIVNPLSQRQSLKYIDDAVAAVNKWSEVLKRDSGNYDVWNFNIHTLLVPLDYEDYYLYTTSTSNKIDPAADIIIELKGDSNGEECTQFNGMAYPFPYGIHEAVYSYVYTSCQVHNDGSWYYEYDHDYVYSTVLHEFAHDLGLGHAYNKKGDLMCGAVEFFEHTNIDPCENPSLEKVEPSDFDIKAILYKYGQDGFSLPNPNFEGKYDNERSYSVYIPLN